MPFIISNTQGPFRYVAQSNMYKSINTLSAAEKPAFYYPFLTDTKNYAIPNNISGISDGTLSNANIYYQSSVGYKLGVGSLYNSTVLTANDFSIPNNTYLASKGYCIAFWFKVTGVGMLFKATNPSTSSWYYVFFDGSSLILDNNHQSSIISGINTNVWYHFVWNVPPSGLAYSYINGGVVNGGRDILYSATPNQAYNLSPSRTDIFFDSLSYGASGYMNNFYIYNRPITQVEITTLWQE